MEDGSMCMPMCGGGGDLGDTRGDANDAPSLMMMGDVPLLWLAGVQGCATM